MIFMEEKGFNDVPMPEKSSPKSREGCIVGGTTVKQDWSGNSTSRCYAYKVRGRASAIA